MSSSACSTTWRITTTAREASCLRTYEAHRRLVRLVRSLQARRAAAGGHRQRFVWSLASKSHFKEACGRVADGVCGNASACRSDRRGGFMFRPYDTSMPPLIRLGNRIARRVMQAAGIEIFDTEALMSSAIAPWYANEARFMRATTGNTGRTSQGGTLWRWRARCSCEALANQLCDDWVLREGVEYTRGGVVLHAGP